MDRHLKVSTSGEGTERSGEGEGEERRKKGEVGEQHPRTSDDSWVSLILVPPKSGVWVRFPEKELRDGPGSLSALFSLLPPSVALSHSLRS